MKTHITLKIQTYKVINKKDTYKMKFHDFV